MPEQPPAGAEPGDRPKGGLENVVVGTTSISHVDGARGRLIYRGHDAVALAESGPFESVWYLLENGTMPDAEQLERGRHERRGGGFLRQNRCGRNGGGRFVRWNRGDRRGWPGHLCAGERPRCCTSGGRAGRRRYRQGKRPNGGQEGPASGAHGPVSYRRFTPRAV